MFNPTKVLFNLTYDLVFKEVFSDVVLASRLINVILNQNFKPEDLEVISNELPGGSLEVKNSLYDVRLNVLNKYDIDLEMQKNQLHNDSLIDRIIFYNAKMIAQSVNAGSYYFKGKTCISVVFLNFPLSGFDKCVNTLSISDEKGRSLSKHKIYLIDLTKSYNCDNLILKRWLELIKSEKVEVFEGDEIMSEVVKKVFSVNADERIRARLLSEEKYRRDREIELLSARDDAIKEGLAKGLEQGLTQGLEQGIEQGLEQGIEQGKMNAKLEIAKKMKEINLPLETIVELTSLNEDQIKKL